MKKTSRDADLDAYLGSQAAGRGVDAEIDEYLQQPGVEMPEQPGLLSRAARYAGQAAIGAPIESAKAGIREFREAPPSEGLGGRLLRYGRGALNLANVPFAPGQKVGGDIGEVIGRQAAPVVPWITRAARALTPHMDPFADPTVEASREAAATAGQMLGATVGGAVGPIAAGRTVGRVLRGRPPIPLEPPSPRVPRPTLALPGRVNEAIPVPPEMVRPSTRALTGRQQLALPPAPREALVRGGMEPPPSVLKPPPTEEGILFGPTGRRVRAQAPTMSERERLRALFRRPISAPERAPTTGEAGGARLQTLATLGRTAAGGVIGGTQGETPQERARNALLGAGAAFAVPYAYRGLRALGERGSLGRPPEVQPQYRREILGRVEQAAREPVSRGTLPPTITERVLSRPAAVVDSMQALLAPATRGEFAQRAAGIIRPQLAELARKTEVAREQLKRYERAMEGLPVAEQHAIADAIESGQALSKESSPIAATIRSLLDGRRRDVQNLGTGKLEHFIENYYPHIWKDPDRARDAFAAAYGRRPLAGSGAFLKQRTIPTLAEGRALGLEPVSSNPATSTLLKLREMDRYVMGQTILREMRDAGLAQLVPYEGRPPAGWTRINDKIARAGSAGQYWAPEPAARVLNNHLSPGLQGNVAFDAFRGLGNTLNQAQLGFSAFHLGFVSFDTTTSKVALAVQQLAAGRPLQAAKSVLSAPVAPFTTYLKGNKVLREYFHPGAGGAEMAAMIDQLMQAGGRARMDRFYGGTALDAFWKAMKGRRYGEATVRAFPALLETISKPLMEEYVPRVKLGVFADLAEFEMSKLPAGASREQVVQVLGRAWDSVDNRLGQLVYDNVFWNRTLKDVLLASVRSVGWNLGTIRELGGGVVDVAKMAGRAARGRPIEMTPRMAYTVALPFIAGLYGATYQYLATGRGPEQLKDYYYPKTGRIRPDGSDDRVSLPSYMKDIFAYTQHPWTTVKHKLNPSIALIAEMLENEDYYGAAIRNPDDPLIVQMIDEVNHAVGGLESFSFRAFQQELQTGANPAEAAQGFIGITPAPASMVRDPEQQAAIERRARQRQIRKKQRRERQSSSPVEALKEYLRD